MPGGYGLVRLYSLSLSLSRGFHVFERVRAVDALVSILMYELDIAFFWLDQQVIEGTHHMDVTVSKGLLKSEAVYQYVLETSVFPREPQPLKELREVTAGHPLALMGTAPDAGQMMDMLLKLVNARKTIEVGVFTGYSLLLTALSIPHDGKIIAIDMDRETYEIGLPIIQKAGVEHKIDFVESEALAALDKLLEDHGNEASFDFVYVDADKVDYSKYHERVIKLLRIGGIVMYDNTLWEGTVVMPEEAVAEDLKPGRQSIIEFNKSLAADPRVQICHATLGDGSTICRRLS